jgi:hypothetical protein
MDLRASHNRIQVPEYKALQFSRKSEEILKLKGEDISY